MSSTRQAVDGARIQPARSGPPNRSRTLLLVGTAALIAAGGGFVALDRFWAVATVVPEAVATEAPSPGDSVEVAPAALRNMDLRFATAEVRPLVRIVRATGMVAFNGLRMAQLSPPARGRIQSIEVAVGQSVRAGERLALLDNFELGDTRSRIAAAQAALTQAKAEAAAAGAAYGRAGELVRIGGLARSELERRRAELARADAATRTREAELRQWKETEQRQMPAGPPDASAGAAASALQGPANSRGAVVASFAGIIQSIGAVPGELVDTTRPLFTLADLSSVWVQADVGERDLGAIAVGQDVSVGVAAYPGRVFAGRVAYIPDHIDARSGTARIRCEVPNLDGALRANMFASADIQSPLGRSGILVPDAALQDIDGQQVVFTPGAPGHFDRHLVRLGLRAGGFTEIVDGLAAGTPVVTDGSFWLKAALMRPLPRGPG